MVLLVHSPPRPPIYFSLRKKRNVPVSPSANLLPSSKIATINQKVLKEATSNFMDDFFFNFSNIIPISSAHYCVIPPSPPLGRRHPQTPSSIWPAPLWFHRRQRDSLSYSFWLTFPSFLMLTRLEPAFRSPSTPTPTPSEAEHTSKCGTRGVEYMTSLA